jgi:hypothetical protein
VAVYLLWLGLRHRGLTLFTAANPGIDAGGFVNESKAAILEGLAAAGDAVPPWRLLPASAAVPSRLDAVRRFIAEHGLTLPIVLKPDAGQRGSGVVVARSLGVIDDYLSRARYDVLVQAYVPGDEFGVFYARRPSDDHGQVFAITVKRLPVVVGDGRRTLDELILRDPRAVAMAPIYRAAQEARLNEVVRDGESVQLVDLGTHCRGAYFSEGIELNTPALEAEIDRISRVFPGFYFGRFDVRSPSVDDFRRGVLRVIELNGVTSEATSIYDRSRTLLEAYRTLFAQWRLAFAIGRENRDRGHPSVGPIELARLVGRYRATSAGHV